MPPSPSAQSHQEQGKLKRSIPVGSQSLTRRKHIAYSDSAGRLDHRNLIRVELPNPQSSPQRLPAQCIAGPLARMQRQRRPGWLTTRTSRRRQHPKKRGKLAQGKPCAPVRRHQHPAAQRQAPRTAFAHGVRALPPRRWDPAHRRRRDVVPARHGKAGRRRPAPQNAGPGPAQGTSAFRLAAVRVPSRPPATPPRRSAWNRPPPATVLTHRPAPGGAASQGGLLPVRRRRPRRPRRTRTHRTRRTRPGRPSTARSATLGRLQQAAAHRHATCFAPGRLPITSSSPRHERPHHRRTAPKRPCRTAAAATDSGKAISSPRCPTPLPPPDIPSAAGALSPRCMEPKWTAERYSLCTMCNVDRRLQRSQRMVQVQGAAWTGRVVQGGSEWGTEAGIWLVIRRSSP